nr:glycerophosphodiester phosphodiesterase family protein [Cucumibacter marinus]
MAVTLLVIALWAWNSSLLAPPPEGEPRLLAHRGVHQTFHRENLENDTCTAERIDPPTHGFIENTIPSMAAAFEAGADVVELDVHLTTDGRLAVFHDWTLDCRTEGTGVTGETGMATIRSLDAGYGYTADNGKTFPLRGKGIGMIPSLDEVLQRFPEQRFLINYKSGRPEEGEALAELVADHPEWRNAIWGAYGGAEPTFAAMEGINGLRGYSRKSAMNCLINYLALGWTGYVPEECRNTLVPVPANYAWLLWGWPNRFAQRLNDAGSEIILLGPFEDGDFGSRGIDSLDEVSLIPHIFTGYVWTNRIEVIAPALTQR